MNLMLTGRLGMAAPGAKAYPQTVFVMTFGTRAQAPSDAAAWTHGHPGCRQTTDPVELRDRDADADGQGLSRAGRRDAAGRRLGREGPDADDPRLTFDVWRERIATPRANSRTC